MIIWLKQECYDAVKSYSRVNKVNTLKVVAHFIGEPTAEWSGDNVGLEVSRYVPFHDLLKGGNFSRYLHVDRTLYKNPSPAVLNNKLSVWPKMTDARHHTRMKETFPDANPALWHLKAALRLTEQEACDKYGLFGFSHYKVEPVDANREWLMQRAFKIGWNKVHTVTGLKGKLVDILPQLTIQQLREICG